MRCFLVCFCLVFCGACGSHQGAGDTTVSQKQLSIDDVKTLSKNGLPDNTIINRIRETHSVFHLTKDQIIDLENAGVSDSVIDYMIQTGKNAP